MTFISEQTGSFRYFTRYTSHFTDHYFFIFPQSFLTIYHLNRSTLLLLIICYRHYTILEETTIIIAIWDLSSPRQQRLLPHKTFCLGETHTCPQRPKSITKINTFTSIKIIWTDIQHLKGAL